MNLEVPKTSDFFRKVLKNKQKNCVDSLNQYENLNSQFETWEQVLHIVSNFFTIQKH